MKYVTLVVLAVFCMFNSKAQKSLKFDGINDEVRVSTYNGVSGTTDRTFEAWVKIPATANNDQLVFWGQNVTSQKWIVRINSAQGGVLRAEVNGGHINGSTNLKDNKWHHVAVTWKNDGSPDITDAKLYVDGILENIKLSQARSINTASTGNVRIGNGTNPGQSFEGQMDEVRIWNTELSVSELRNWMCQEVNSTHAKFSNLQGYWKMDTLAGSVVKDYSGRNRNGAIANGAVWQNNGGPVGTVSSNKYVASGTLSLKHADGDSVVVGSVTGSPRGIHLYYRSSIPNQTTAPSSVNAFDSSRHWGIHFVGGTNASASYSYYFLPNTHYLANGGCFNEMLRRNNNATTSWSIVTANNQGGAYSFTASAGEYMLGYAGGNVIISAPGGKDTTQVCQGDSVVIGNSSAGFTYRWMYNNQLLTNDTLSTLKAATTGNYQLIVTGSGCNDSSNVLRVNMNNNPQVSLQAFTPVCASVFSIPLQGGNPVGGVYQSTYASGNMFIVQTAGPGLHQIKYEYQDSVGCSDTASQWLEVLALPNVQLAQKSPVCADSSVHNLSGGTPVGGSYFVNGSASSSFDAVALGAGNHQIKYTYTDSNNCSSADSISAAVIALPNVVLNLIKSKFCEYDAAWNIDGHNPRGGVFAGNGVSGFTFTPSSAGAGDQVISYTITDGQTGCKNTARDTIEVVGRPVRPVLSQVGDSLKSTASSTYRWYDMSGGIAGETKQSYGPQEEGDYYVRVQENGCWSLFSDTLAFKFTGVFSEGSKTQTIRLYPNPAGQQLYFTGDNLELMSIRILNSAGMEVHSSEIPFNDDGLDISGINPGVYYVQIKSHNGEIISLPLLIQR